MSEPVTLDRATAAVEFTRDHSELYGRLVGRCKGLEHQRKVIKAQEILASEAKTVAEREAEAESSAAYLKIVEDIENAWADKTTLETRLKAAEMTFDLYRSSNKWGTNIG